MAVKRRPWQFPDSEVRVITGDEGVLGKGAYGEVRKGTWRGIPIAAKRLHMLTGGKVADFTCNARPCASICSFFHRNGPT